MPTELDIFRSASVLIEHHGEKAAHEAAERAVRMHARGDHDGAHVWWAILNAIETLQKTMPEGAVN